MRALHRFSSLLLAPGLLLALACSTDKPGSPTAPPTSPIPPVAGVNVSVVASLSELEVNSTNSSLVRIRATRADTGQALPNLTPVALTTTLGSFGSQGGPGQMDLELVGGEASVPFFAGGTIGSATIRAAVSSGVGFATIIVREQVDPETFFLSSISPSTGSPQGGDTVTIFGGGFSDPIRVTFNGAQAQIQNATGTQIRVTTPPCSFNGGDACFSPGASTPADVQVIVNLNEAGEANDTLSGGFVYQAGGGGGGNLQPVIFSVVPSSGPNDGGNQVTINGDGFDAPVEVLFGPAPAQVVTVTQSRVVVIAPPATGIGQPNLNQAVSIRVTNQLTGRTTTATQAYRYGVNNVITSIAPGQGSIYGGELVTIFGQGFDSPAAVTFGGLAQQVMSVSGSEVVVRTVHPTTCNAGGAVVVTNIESGDTAQGASFNFLGPNIFSLSPSSGPQGGGTVLTIGGDNFGMPIIVDFTANGTSRAGVVSAATDTTITVMTPSMPDIALTEVDCNDNAIPPTGKKWLATAAAVKVTDPISGCTDTFQGTFVFNPSDTSCRGD